MAQFPSQLHTVVVFSNHHVNQHAIYDAQGHLPHKVVPNYPHRVNRIKKVHETRSSMDDRYLNQFLVFEIRIDIPIILILIDISHSNDHGCIVAIAEVRVEGSSEGLHCV